MASSRLHGRGSSFWAPAILLRRAVAARSAIPVQRFSWHFGRWHDVYVQVG